MSHPGSDEGAYYESSDEWPIARPQAGASVGKKKAPAYTGTDRRREQNRLAQRKFRARQEQELVDLRNDVARLHDSRDAMRTEMMAQKTLVIELRAENSRLQQIVDAPPYQCFPKCTHNSAPMLAFDIDSNTACTESPTPHISPGNNLFSLPSINDADFSAPARCGSGVQQKDVVSTYLEFFSGYHVNSTNTQNFMARPVDFNEYAKKALSSPSLFDQPIMQSTSMQPSPSTSRAVLPPMHRNFSGRLDLLGLEQQRGWLHSALDERAEL